MIVFKQFIPFLLLAFVALVNGAVECEKAWILAFQRTSTLFDVQKAHAKDMIEMMQSEDGMLTEDHVSVISWGSKAFWISQDGSEASKNVSTILSTIDGLEPSKGKAQNYASFFDLLEETSPELQNDTVYTVVLYTNGGDTGGNQKNHRIFRRNFVRNWEISYEQFNFACIQTLKEEKQRPKVWRQTDLCDISEVLLPESSSYNESAAVVLDASQCPTFLPTTTPTRSPSAAPSVSPTTREPTNAPTEVPTLMPSRSPSVSPTMAPAPTTSAPTTLIFSLAAPCPKKWIFAFQRSSNLLKTQKAHALAMIDRMPVNDEGVLTYSEVAIMLYHSQAKFIVSFATGASRSKEAIVDAIESLKFTKGGRNYNKMLNRLQEAPEEGLLSGGEEIYTVVLYSNGGKKIFSNETGHDFIESFLTNYNIDRDQLMIDCVMSVKDLDSGKKLFKGAGLCDNSETILSSDDANMTMDKAIDLFSLSTCRTDSPTAEPSMFPTASPFEEPETVTGTFPPTDSVSVFPEQPPNPPEQKESTEAPTDSLAGPASIPEPPVFPGPPEPVDPEFVPES